MNLVDLDAYTNWTDTVWKPNDNSLSIEALGLAGEAGEVAEFFKKFLHHGKEFKNNPDLLKEFGDVIFYWCRLVRRAGFTPDQVIAANMAKLNERYASFRAEREVA